MPTWALWLIAALLLLGFLGWALLAGAAKFREDAERERLD